MSATLIRHGARRAETVAAASAAGVALVLAGLVVLLLPYLLHAVPTPDPAEAVRWYGAMAADEGWRLAAWNSLRVGVGAALVASIAGTGAALVLRFGRFRGKGPSLAALLLLAALPSACLAVAWLAGLAPLGWAGRFRGLVMAHAALGTPLVVAAVLLALRPLRPVALRTMASLGVPPGMLFGSVVLPLAWPGIAAGALLAFAASLGDAVLSGLLAPTGQLTVARRVLDTLRGGTPGPDAWAAGALVALCCLLLAGTAALLLRIRLRPVLRGQQVG